jgi:hypothetical protein
MQLPQVVKDVEVLADRDLRSLEALGQFRDQNPSVAIHKFENGPPTLFIEHDQTAFRPGTVPLAANGARAFDCCFFL